jgi:hypothetical protein
MLLQLICYILKYLKVCYKSFLLELEPKQQPNKIDEAVAWRAISERWSLSCDMPSYSNNCS